jgi:hypothetical protein
MTRTWIRTTAPVLAMALVLWMTGCAEPGRHEVAGTALGGALGAGTGAIIGSQVGAPGAGIAIGAGMGAAAGNLIGRGLDEVRAARRHARNGSGWVLGAARSALSVAGAPSSGLPAVKPSRRA